MKDLLLSLMLTTGIETYSLPVDKQDLNCLTNAIYKESEVKIQYNDISMILVSQVILNRAKDNRFPSNVCSVIKQKINGYCLFSFYCLKGHSYMPDMRRYNLSRIVAYNALQGHYEGITPALFYKRCEVKDRWFKRNTVMLYKIRSHCFYVYRRN